MIDADVAHEPPPDGLKFIHSAVADALAPAAIVIVAIECAPPPKLLHVVSSTVIVWPLVVTCVAYAESCGVSTAPINVGDPCASEYTSTVSGHSLAECAHSSVTIASGTPSPVTSALTTFSTFTLPPRPAAPQPMSVC